MVNFHFSNFFKKTWVSANALKQGIEKMTFQNISQTAPILGFQHISKFFFRKNCKLSPPLLIKYTKYFSQDKKSISIKIILFRFYSTSSHFYPKKSQAKSAKNYEANFNEISVLLLLHFSAIKEVARQPLNFIK